MKNRAILVVIFALCQTLVCAINYPTYKSLVRYVHVAPKATISAPNFESVQKDGYYDPMSSYHSPALSNGTTIQEDGMDMIQNSAFGPYKVHYAGTTAPGTPAEGDTFTDGSGVTWIWDGEDWIKFSENAGDPAPIGSPIWPLMVLMMGYLVLKVRKNEDILHFFDEKFAYIKK